MTLAAGLTLACAAAGLWYVRQSGRLDGKLSGLRAGLGLARINLRAADSAADLARGNLAKPDPRNLTLLTGRPDSLPDEVVPEPQAARTLEAAGRWAIQVSSRRLEADARAEAAALGRRTGLSPGVERVAVGVQVWFRVLITGLPDEAAARGLADSLLAAGAIHEYVLQERNRPVNAIEP
ncbi:SPOR domain-containing protein [bacterium]|nr:SPOR domain-containing protein [bacterium]